MVLSPACEVGRVGLKPREAGLPSCLVRGPVPCRPPLPGSLSPGLAYNSTSDKPILLCLSKSVNLWLLRSGGATRACPAISSTILSHASLCLIPATHKPRHTAEGGRHTSTQIQGGSQGPRGGTDTNLQAQTATESSNKVVAHDHQGLQEDGP